MKNAEGIKYRVVKPEGYVVGQEYGILKCYCSDKRHQAVLMKFSYRTGGANDDRDAIFVTEAGETHTGRHLQTYCRNPQVTDFEGYFNKDFRRWLKR